MRRYLPPLVIVLVLTGFLMWWFSDKQVVKRRTKDLMEVLTLDVATPSGTRNLGSIKLGSLLAPKVEIKVASIADANGSFDRSEVNSAFGWLCGSAKETKLKIKSLDSIEVNGDHATVTATLDALVDLKYAKPVDGPGTVTLKWAKLKDDGWRLDGAAWVPQK